MSVPSKEMLDFIETNSYQVPGAGVVFEEVATDQEVAGGDEDVVDVEPE